MNTRSLFIKLIRSAIATQLESNKVTCNIPEGNCVTGMDPPIIFVASNFTEAIYTNCCCMVATICNCLKLPGASAYV